MISSLCILALASLAHTAAVNPRQASSSSVPDYFQITPDLFPGPTATAKIVPFLAQTDPAPFGAEASYVPNEPLQSALPIVGNTNNSNIFQLVGQLSSYFPSPGFGADEYPLPPSANISVVNVLHRHGSRYPTSSSAPATFGAKLHNITMNGTAKWSGDLSILNSWRYTMGAEILVHQGWSELFQSGVLHYYSYGALFNGSNRFVARTTSEDRMLKSAEYFMAGFFGLDWQNNVTLEVIIEQTGYNNSLAGSNQCNNSNSYQSTGGNNASLIWESIYLKNATERFRSMSGGYNWSTSDSYNLQTLCPYETVAFGYSEFCDLFTFEEWQGFEYSIDLQFYGNNGFGSPTGRGVGIGYVEELYARLSHHLYNLPPGSTNVNTTLDEMTSTFPLNQSLYFDFSHDTNIYSIITALGLTQFRQFLPPTGPPANQQAIVSHMTPFGARFVIEIINAPQPVKATRPTGTNATMADYYDAGPATSYIHMKLSQRTLPLHKSYPECPQRDDGWCELSTVMNVWSSLLSQARYDYSCFGDYPSVAYGNVSNGVPTVKRDVSELYMLSRGMGSGLVSRMDSDELMRRV